MDNTPILPASAFLDVEMHLRPMKDVRIKRVRQVVPEIKELALKEPEERHLVAGAGPEASAGERPAVDRVDREGGRAAGARGTGTGT